MSEKHDLFYDPKSFVCMETENFLEYFDKYSTLIHQNAKMTYSQLPEKLKRDALFNKLGVNLSKSQRKELENICSPDNLMFNEEIRHTSHNHFYNPTSVNFKIPECANHLKVIDTKKKWLNKFGKVFPYRNQKEQPPTDPLDQNLFANSDIVFVVKDYHPFKCNNESTVKKDRVKCNFEIVVLGSQTLADLRDKIVCSNDMGYSVELQTPVEMVTPKVKDNCPSGFMFIENCFYNDMRHEKAIDYSEPIRRWNESKNWTSGLMEKTKISDLMLRLGYPYLYQHQGSCEHIIIFADVRLLRETDPLNNKEYPYFQYESRYASTVCYMCGQELSKYVVVDGDRLPNKMTYMCGECLVSYNFIDGERVGHFKLYPYFDRSCFD